MKWIMTVTVVSSIPFQTPWAPWQSTAVVSSVQQFQVPGWSSQELCDEAANKLMNEHVLPADLAPPVIAVCQPELPPGYVVELPTVRGKPLILPKPR